MTTQPEFKPPVFEAVYRAAVIASCPRCGTDLDDEGFSYWCPACREGISAAEACMFDEGYVDD